MKLFTTKPYRSRHADENRAPTGTECVGCEKTEPGTEQQPIKLTLCSVCKEWRCTTCYSQHSAPDEWYVPQTRRAWWLQAVRRG